MRWNVDFIARLQSNSFGAKNRRLYIFPHFQLWFSKLRNNEWITSWLGKKDIEFHWQNLLLQQADEHESVGDANRGSEQPNASARVAPAGETYWVEKTVILETRQDNAQ